MKQQIPMENGTYIEVEELYRDEEISYNKNKKTI